jgi:hypothetical protein
LLAKKSDILKAGLESLSSEKGCRKKDILKFKQSFFSLVLAKKSEFWKGWSRQVFFLPYLVKALAIQPRAGLSSDDLQQRNVDLEAYYVGEILA